MPRGLEYFYPHLAPFLLVLFRMSGIFFFAPMLGSMTVPVKAKIILTLSLSLCVYPMLLQPGSAALANVAPVVAHPISVYMLPVAVAMELLVGYVIGFGASLPMLGMQIAGQINDQQMGLGFGSIFNPDIDAQLGAVAQFYYLLGTTLFLIIGGDRVLLSTMVGSFGHIPLGGFEMTHDIFTLIIGLLTAAFELALRVSAPLLCLIFLETVAMGFLARTVPQLNILSVGFPIRIIAGLCILIASLAVVIHVWHDANFQTLRGIMAMFTGR